MGAYRIGPAGGVILIVTLLVVFVVIPLLWMAVLNYFGAPIDDSVERRGPAGWLDRRRKRAAERAYEGESARSYTRKVGGRWPTSPPMGRGGGRMR